MKTFSIFQRRAVGSAIIAFSAFFLSACDRDPEFFKRPHMTHLSPRLQPLFEKEKTVCFGRFVLDIPATATVVYGPAGADGGNIERYPGEGHKLSQHVAARLVEVEKDRDFLDKEDLERLPLFGKAIEGRHPAHKLVFGSKNHVVYSIDSYISVGEDLFVQSAVSAVSKDETVARLNKVASHLRTRAKEEVPAEPGICIDGGFLPLLAEYERVAIGIRLSEFPDVHFSIEVIKNQDKLVESSALEPRLNDAEKNGGSWYSGVKFLRRGQRELGNWTGFEVLAHKPPQRDDTDSHEFHFHSLGAPRNLLQPQLDIQLDTGVKDDRMAKIKPSLTDEEAVDLWDKLTASIRVRATDDGTSQSAAERPKFPLGTYVDTGTICPQSGWWQCSEGGEFVGGRRHRFAEGCPMPHAVLVDKRGVWQKLKGERPTQRIATVWQLVKYEPEPEVQDAISMAAVSPHGELPDGSPDTERHQRDFGAKGIS